MFLAGSRILLSWMRLGPTRMSMSQRSLPGLGSENPHWSAIGWRGWQSISIAPPSSFLAGPSGQGSSAGASFADEFLDSALASFGDPDPRIGTPWGRGERLAKLIMHRRALLILDGLELLQNPPVAGGTAARALPPGTSARACGLQFRSLRDHDPNGGRRYCGSRAEFGPRRDLEQLSSDAGAKLLRSLEVKGHEAELRAASDELGGHCLALTLLASYLTDVYNGDIRCRGEASSRFAQDVRKGLLVRKVMESYQTWFGEGSELSVLRLLGLFDRPPTKGRSELF